MIAWRAERPHGKADAMCFIGRSVSFPVYHEPKIGARIYGRNDVRRLLVCLTALLLTACGTTATRINLADTCEGKPARSQCWMELTSHPGCYVWNAFLLDGMTASWDGSCSGQLAEGAGTLTYTWEDKAQVGRGSLVGGKSDGPWVLHHADGRVEEVTYANGKMGES